MIGTSYEMLLYFSYQHSTCERLGLHPQRLTRMRNRISFKAYPEEDIIALLTKLDCKCIRPQIVLPAVVQDRFGKMFDENTFIKLFLTQEVADKWNVSRPNALSKITQNQFVDIATLKHLVRTRRAKIVQARMILDSVWSYEPIDTTFDNEKIVQVRKILGFK